MGIEEGFMRFLIKNLRRIKNAMRKKIRFYKGMIIEILETLCTICLFLDIFSRRNYIPDGVHFHSHFNELKMYSEHLREGNK